VSPLGPRLQAKILAVVLLGVSLPSVLGGFYLLRRHHELLTEKLRENLANHLFRQASEMDDWTSQRRREVQRWSGSFVVVEGVEAVSRGRGDTTLARRDVTAYLESVLGHYRGYESLFVVDAAGRVLASTREERLDPAEVELLRSDAADGRVTPIRRSIFLGRPSLLVSHAVEGTGGTAIGFFVERPDVHEIEAILATRPGDPPASFWLIDSDGKVVVRQGRVEAEPGASAFPGERPPSDAEAGPVRDAVLPGVGEVVYGVRHLKSGDFLAVTVPAAAAYRSLVESRNRLLAFGLAGLAAVMLVSLLLARGIVQPIRLLSEGARRMSAGDLSVTLPVRGQDELAELTRSFNEMAERVREVRDALESLAITDGLTGLYNRRHFDDVLARELRRADREKIPLSLALIDLDRFKQYNDLWGHREGDVELVRVATRVRKALRATDLAFRYGGEELAVLLPACPRGEVAGVAEKIRLAINADLPQLGGRGTTASLGVATAPDDASSPQDLVEAADRALYAAKARGRNRVEQADADASRI